MSPVNYEQQINSTLAELSEKNTAWRLWQKDYTLWKPEPSIFNSLGWLNVSEHMPEQVGSLESFAREISDAGFAHVVLLGMGGSSLGAAVLRQTFGKVEGYPEMIVLDSTVPATVQAVAQAIDPAHTLFLVSSKSGGTTETMMLYYYFRSLVEKAKGKDTSKSFAAITDPGSPLVKLAQEWGFRRVFLNPTDIGGRYSVLSNFGLVPAALMGIDLSQLLERAERMRQRCFASIPDSENHGLLLGAFMGTLAKSGKDKLMLLTSPAIASFGLWAEQLIAESLGKEGKGIIPVTGEPLEMAAIHAGDRFFVCLRLKDDDNFELDNTIAHIKSVGQPLFVLELNDRFDLGAEFFRWEFATAAAGAVLGLNPFDQPNVELTKVITRELLQDYIVKGKLPLPGARSTRDLFQQAGAGKYLAIMAFIQPTPEVDGVFCEFRRSVVKRFGMATVLGYGPRFLHSTGQLFKGGPVTGLFLQVTAKHETDLPVPGKPYSLGVVTDAEALGDFKALRTSGQPVTRLQLERADAGELERRLNKLVPVFDK